MVINAMESTEAALGKVVNAIPAPRKVMTIPKISIENGCFKANWLLKTLSRTMISTDFLNLLYSFYIISYIIVPLFLVEFDGIQKA